jgi:hypothetical protein
MAGAKANRLWPWAPNRCPCGRDRADHKPYCPFPVFLPGLAAKVAPAAPAIEMMTAVFECFSGHLFPPQGFGASLVAKSGPASIVTGPSALCRDPSQGFLLSLEAGHDEMCLNLPAADLGHVGPVLRLDDSILGFCHSGRS